MENTLITVMALSSLVLLLDIAREKRIKMQFINFTKEPFAEVPSREQQEDKVMEETTEFLVPTSHENQIEEYYDLIQASTNLLQLRGYTKAEIIRGQAKHLKKLKSRGVKFK